MSYGSYGVARGLAPVRQQLTAAEVHARRKANEPLRLLDTRDGPEHQRGTLPGAVHLGQMLLTNHETRTDGAPVKALLAEIVPSDEPLLLIGPESDQVVGSRLGGTPQCVEIVAAYLGESGVAWARIYKLTGGVAAWQAAGFEIVVPGADATALSSLRDAIAAAGLDADGASAASLLGATSLGSVDALLREDGGRAKMMEQLKAAGFGLKERQTLANSLAKAQREGRLRVEEGG